ncbi:MAG: hypothetical protein HY547_10465 [Elusimicrobia bacterium]|nr:hypothetical protein [Elusimicrobiota bacterium]
MTKMQNKSAVGAIIFSLAVATASNLDALGLLGLAACNLGLQSTVEDSTTLETGGAADTGYDCLSTVDAVEIKGALLNMNYFYLTGCDYDSRCTAELTVNLVQGYSYIGGQLSLTNTIFISTSGTFTSLFMLPTDAALDPTGESSEGYTIGSLTLEVTDHQYERRYVMTPYAASEPLWETPQAPVNGSNGACVGTLASMGVIFDALNAQEKTYEE